MGEASAAWQLAAWRSSEGVSTALDDRPTHRVIPAQALHDELRDLKLDPGLRRG